MRGRAMLLGLALLAPLALAGCGDASHSCSGTSCTVTFTKVGASTNVDQETRRKKGANGKTRTRTTDPGVSMRLESVAGDTARISVRGDTDSCRQGQTVVKPSLTYTCTVVSAKQVKLAVSLHR